MSTGTSLILGSLGKRSAQRSLRRLVLTSAIVPLVLTSAARGDESSRCGTDGETLAYWEAVKAQAATAPADELAGNLFACLGSPDPALRDGVGYELFTYWLREQKLSDESRRELLRRLREKMNDPAAGATLSRSFSALILAELMRSDAISPFMTAGERGLLLADGAAALERETDFRGLDPELGWVHPIAHLADLMWRFSLHPDTTEPEATQILEAVRARVAPTEIAYAFNEGDRLARVAATLIRRDLVGSEQAVAWLESFESPRSMDTWSQAFRSVHGMYELHNTKQFLRALADQLAGAEISDDVRQTLDALVAGFTSLI